MVLEALPTVSSVRKMMPKPPPQVFELTVTLDGVEPAIWRRLLVPANLTLPRVHRLLNEVMGWTNSHLHAFEVEGRRFEDPTLSDGCRKEVDDERRVRLSQLVVPGQSLRYEYDFGDGWTHTVEVEDIREADPLIQLPACVAGARACPPEDCGGPLGYADLLEALQDERHPEHETLTRWVGGTFDAEGFDLNRTNAALRRLRSRT